jgi:hypothetical protein
MCRPCSDAGRGRKLAEFDLAPSGPAQTHHTLGRWTGTEPDDRVHLRCPCGHEPRPLGRRAIIETLNAITGKSVIYL